MYKHNTRSSLHSETNMLLYNHDDDNEDKPRYFGLILSSDALGWEI